MNKPKAYLQGGVIGGISPISFVLSALLTGCDGVALSGKVIDSCGVCGGDGSSCAGIPRAKTIILLFNCYIEPTQLGHFIRLISRFRYPCIHTQRLIALSRLSSPFPKLCALYLYIYILGFTAVEFLTSRSDLGA